MRIEDTEIAKRKLAKLDRQFSDAAPSAHAAGDGSLDPLVLRIRQARGRRDSCWNRLCKAQDAYRQSEAHLNELASELVQCVEGNAQNVLMSDAVKDSRK